MLNFLSQTNDLQNFNCASEKPRLTFKHKTMPTRYG